MLRLPTPIDTAIERTAKRLCDLQDQLIAASPKQFAALQRLATELGFDATLAPDEAESARRITWDPVAEDCVVTIVRALLGASGGPQDLSDEDFRCTWQVAAQEEVLAEELGLPVQLGHAALLATEAVLLELFAQPTTLEMDGEEYVVHRDATRRRITVTPRDERPVRQHTGVKERGDTPDVIPSTKANKKLG